MERFSTRTLLRGDQHPVGILMGLLIGVTALFAASVVAPLAIARIALARTDRALLVYFAAIGAGFMLIEVAMLQRLIVFLGHPAYSLSVILFVLLLATGAGARLSARLRDERLREQGLRVLLVTGVVLAAAVVLTSPLVSALKAAETPVRIAASAALLTVMGVLMGTAFPLGLRLAVASRPALAPWLWGINGATSVLGSVLAVVVAMAFGISASLWAGVASYAAAAMAFAVAARRAA